MVSKLPMVGLDHCPFCGAYFGGSRLFHCCVRHQQLGSDPDHLVDSPSIMTPRAENNGHSLRPASIQPVRLPAAGSGIDGRRIPVMGITLVGRKQQQPWASLIRYVDGVALQCHFVSRARLSGSPPIRLGWCSSFPCDSMTRIPGNDLTGTRSS